MEALSYVEINSIRNGLKAGLRMDGRLLNQRRNIKIILDRVNGTSIAEISLGDTKYTSLLLFHHTLEFQLLQHVKFYHHIQIDLMKECLNSIYCIVQWLVKNLLYFYNVYHSNNRKLIKMMIQC